MIRVYIAQIDEEKEYCYNDFIQVLPIEKKEHLLRYRFKKDLLLSLLGEILLRYGLKDMYGYYEELEIFYGKHKKPYLKKPNVFFNISHSGKFTVCALGDSEIGVDIQEKEMRDTEELLTLGTRFFSAKEAQDLSGQFDKKDYFYQLWTLKESYIKYRGTGLYYPLDSFGFQIKDNDIEYFNSEEMQGALQFKCFDYRSDYKLAICTEEPIGNDILFEVNNELIDRELNIKRKDY
ncbi:4'-phosphopantetheinyl transferase family protein [Clostridium aminobutyricum]|uniref:4'-phosphopantetheinyl transferase superfamily protein n=1 Tax=Clostridium aminobutyricum TaxID=33953 RepID=A0A939IJT4_CLOAM|nr:4'-phosphopantetheinyl transferase superfamily protein [Clostridium aminobutyricum]MBN7773923.1 4'-phosphopantetheinyl transferase superfamily protein [Clostridium aminobutyricum]